MTTTELRAAIHQLVDKEDNGEVLQAIRELLDRAALNYAWRTALTSRVAEAEAEYKANGRTYSVAEVMRHIETDMQE